LATAVAVSSTGNAEIDGLLAGSKWTGTITYSFPDSPGDYSANYFGNGEPTTAGFSPAPSQMQAAINYAIALIEGYTNATIQFAGTNGADIMVAQSPAANPASYAYYPANVPAGGDVWFGTQYNYTLAALGNYYFTTALHELGHGFGLKHSQETGGVANVAVPAAHDDSEFTVMSYRSYVGGPLTGYTNEAYGYPQTYMANDILALQTLYGANYSTHSENTVYSWSPTTGQEFINGVGQLAPGGGVGGSANRVFETIWDGNGIDTYDMSNYTTGVSIDLNPGASSITSSAQLAYLGNGHYAQGNVFNAYLFNNDPRSYIDNAIGGSGNDTLVGNAIANTLSGGAGNDILSGGGGNDILIGGTGIDTLTGGTGTDTFVFATGDSSPVAGQHDLITDFTPGVDHIDLSGIDAISSTPAHDGFHFIGAAAFDGTAGALDYVYDATRGVTVLEGDTNGDRVADFAIDLTGNIALNVSDFAGSVTAGIVAGPLVAVADFNGDGHGDILWQNSNGTVAIWDSGQMAAAHTVPNPGVVPSSSHIVGTGDFDGNGQGDILWRDDNGAVFVWDNGNPAGAHTLSAAGVVATSWHIVGTGDFDGNHHDDILWQNDNGAVSIWDNGQITGAHIISSAGTVASSWHIAGTGDFDSNGHADILWQNSNGAVSIWDNGQINGAHIIFGPGLPSSWHIVGTGDFDGNGHDDILWQNDNGTVSIWDNGQVTAAHWIANPGTVPSTTHVAGIGDFDHNGHDDILWRDDNVAVSIWDNGQPSAAHTVVAAGAMASGWHIA
jgi:Ca2+-binding RTX toxin-like protein